MRVSSQSRLPTHSSFVTRHSSFSPALFIGEVPAPNRVPFPSYFVPRPSYFSRVPTSTEFPLIRHSSFVTRHSPHGSESPAGDAERVRSPITDHRSPSYPQNRPCSEVETPPPPSYFVPFKSSHVKAVPPHSSFVIRTSSFFLGFPLQTLFPFPRTFPQPSLSVWFTQRNRFLQSLVLPIALPFG